ncbi:MAG TPA: rod shape-determining protein MreC [Dermatophilaceae bacterium]|nr:rod shape-determining protein MreC [Dermatophilaceae bacterium]
MVLIVATVFLLGLDLSHPGSTSFLRTGAAAAFGPLERAMAAGRDDEVTRLTRERDELERARGQDLATVQQAREVTSVLASPAARGAKLLAARVVAFTAQSSTSASSSGGRRVTIDVGYRDGVTKDLTVIAGAGLVGRVIAVAAWTSDVLVVGDRDLTIGVRAGTRGWLGSVSATSPVGAPPRAPGRLSLTMLEQGAVKVGDTVTTLGSVGGRPFIPDVPVGTVVSLDPGRGQLTFSAVVEPIVDTEALDVVAVVLSTPRSVARAPSLGSGK